MLLGAQLSGEAKWLLQHAFQLSAAALADAPDEWPTQLIARLQKSKDSTITSVLKLVEQTRDSCWLKPVRASLVAAGGPIQSIIDVGKPYGNSRSLIWSKDRKTITSFAISSFRIWDMKAQREIRRLDLAIDHGHAAISNPPHRAVVVAGGRQLLLVNLKTSKTDVLFSESFIENVAISADGDWAVTTSVPSDWDYFENDWNGPRTFRLFDLRRRCCVRKWESHNALLNDLAMTSDGRFLLTASRDRTAILFDLNTSSIVGRWKSTREIIAVAITPNGQRVAYIAGGGMLTVRESDGKIVNRSRHSSVEPGCLSLSSDGNRVVFAGDGGWVSMVDLQTQKRSGPFSGTQPYLTSLTIDEEARHALSGEMGRYLLEWDLTVSGKASGPPTWLSGIWASSNKAIVHGDGLAVWDLNSGKSTQLFPHRNITVASAPTARIWALATWSSNRGGRIRIGVWGHKKTTLLHKSRELATGIQISRNGARLVASVHPLGCQVFNLSDRRIIWQNSDLRIGVQCCLSPSGRYLLLHSQFGYLAIVDLDTQDGTLQNLPLPNAGQAIFTHEDALILVQQGDDIVLLNWKTNSARTLFPGRLSSISDD